jgi:hypothetical protein
MPAERLYFVVDGRSMIEKAQPRPLGSTAVARYPSFRINPDMQVLISAAGVIGRVCSHLVLLLILRR